MNSPERPSGRETLASTDKPTVQSPPQKSLTGWTLLLPLVLLGGTAWLGKHASNNPRSTLISDSQGMINAEATPTAESTPAPDKPPVPSSVDRILYLPDDEGHLQRRIIKDKPASIETGASGYEEEARKTLLLLMKTAPDDFPPHARLLGVKVDEAKETATADFDSAFAAPDFWQGSARTLATVYAIVNTLAQVQPKLAKKVQIVIEGKPIDTLGELDTGEPFEADMALVAKS